MVLDVQHIGEMVVVGALNVVVAVKVLQARLNATDARVTAVESDLRHESSRIDSILLK